MSGWKEPLDSLKMAHSTTFFNICVEYWVMCENCGAKFLLCQECGGLFTRVHPALEQWEVNQKCPSCGFEDPNVKAWDGVSAR